MPVDSSIAMGVRPVQFDNPVEGYQRVMALKNIGLQGQLQEAQLQEATRNAGDCHAPGSPRVGREPAHEGCSRRPRKPPRARAALLHCGNMIFSARALLSKDITKWLAQAPRTTNPKAINEHLSQLSAVAGSQSAYRMDAQQIANYLRDAITSKSTTAAAAGEQEQN